MHTPPLAIFPLYYVRLIHYRLQKIMRSRSSHFGVRSHIKVMCTKRRSQRFHVSSKRLFTTLCEQMHRTFSFRHGWKSAVKGIEIPAKLATAYFDSLKQIPALVAAAAERERDADFLACALSAVAAAKGTSLYTSLTVSR